MVHADAFKTILRNCRFVYVNNVMSCILTLHVYEKICNFREHFENKVSKTYVHSDTM